MKRFVLALLLAAGLASSASAQVGAYPWRTPARPTVSPYLNLGRGGSAGINYFAIVRPQIDAQRTFQMLNQEIQQLQPEALGATGFGPTTGATGFEGGAAVYMNYSHYFPLMPMSGINPLAGRR